MALSDSENSIARTDEMRDRLISSTVEAIYRHGFSDATIAKISEIADVSTTTVQNYFPRKEDLLEQTMWSLLDQMHRRVVDGCARAENPRGSSVGDY